MKNTLLKELPGVIVSEPEASIYCIIDFKKIANENFDSNKFVNFCAEKGLVEFDKKMFTVLLAPMKGFYKNSYIGKTQVRLALVESEQLLEIAPKVIATLFKIFSKL